MKFDIWVFFRNSVEQIQDSLKPDKNKGTLHGDQYTFFIISCSVLPRMKNVSDRSSENQNTCFTFKYVFFENFSFYEIMWKNVVQTHRPQTTIWRMSIAYWITKATNTHSQYAILISLPLQQWLNEHTSMLRYSTLPVLLIACSVFVLLQSSCAQKKKLDIDVVKGHFVYWKRLYCFQVNKHNLSRPQLSYEIRVAFTLRSAVYWCAGKEQ
jgi:hypothetical protein